MFVTALPRAGTTILLNLLVGTGSFASHTYRDMPFVLCPMIWQRFAKQFQVSDEARERWEVSEPIRPGWSIFHMAADLRSVLAAEGRSTRNCLR